MVLDVIGARKVADGGALRAVSDGLWVCGVV